MQKLISILIIIFLSTTNAFAEVIPPEDNSQNNPLLEEDIQRVKDIFKRLTASIGADHSEYVFEIHESQEINAYATLGKKIVINTALIENIENEAGLAFVIAHELGHVEEKHVVKSLVRNNFAAFLKYMFFRENQIVHGLDYFHSLHYSRGGEKEADLFAVDVISKSYCKKPGKLEFFHKISKNHSSSRIQEYFSTHPLPATRLEYLEKEIKATGCVL